MNQNPKQLARDRIDSQLTATGCTLQSRKSINLAAAFGVAVREYSTEVGPADCILFVNATEHFEKGKRQNHLRDGGDGEPNGIRKIVDTYQYRKEEPRYRRGVSMDEIAQNGFNLNISRYVSTSTTEEVIDLQEVHTKLQCIQQEAAAAAAKHNAFLKELGLLEIG